MNDDNMLNDEENNYKSIVIWKSPAVIKSYIRPSSLSQNLHHDVLWVNEGIEVRKLDLIVVLSIIINLVILGVIKDLHSQDTEHKEEEKKKIEKLHNNRCDL